MCRSGSRSPPDLTKRIVTIACDDRRRQYALVATRVPQRTYGGVSADERVAARREKLLDAGLELFGTRGFATTGVKDICREARLTDRYFYESFANSEALFLAVFDRLTDDLFGDVASAAGEAGADA